MKKSLKKINFAVFVTLLLTILIFSGCSGNTSKANIDSKYYTGHKGIDMTFEESLPPSKIYYYGDEEDNTFDVTVQVSNKGSSWSRGGIFLSGYDPNMIQIDGISPNPSTSRACRIDVNNIGFGKFGGVLRCDNLMIGLGEDYTEVGLKNLFCAGGRYADKNFDTSKIFGSSACTDVWYRRNGDSNNFAIDFGNPDIDVEYANHGRLLIAMTQGLDFSRTFGVEYLLAGNTYEFPGGETKFVNFEGNIVAWPPGLDSTQQTFLTTNCFMYVTYAAPVVCIDPSPFSENKKVCTPKAYTGTSGQGAPVAVTSIEQENTPRQAIFTIHVKNTGSGRVYDMGALEYCSPYSPVRISNNELNVVYVGDIRVSGDLQRLDCTPNNFVRLDPKTKAGIITCAYDIPFEGLKSAYSAPLVVELWYGYEQTIQKTVTIKRAG